jgi:hypothetical protein
MVHDVPCGYPLGSLFYLHLSDGISLRVNSAWRLDQRGGLNTSWRENNEGPQSPLVLGLSYLVSATIATAEFLATGVLCVTFVEGHILYLFADLTPEYLEEGNVNWAVVDSQNNVVYQYTNTLGWRNVPYHAER